MQQTTSTSLEADGSFCRPNNTHSLQSTYLTHSPKVKASAENANLWYKQACGRLHHSMVRASSMTVCYSE